MLGRNSECKQKDKSFVAWAGRRRTVVGMSLSTVKPLSCYANTVIGLPRSENLEVCAKILTWLHPPPTLRI
jgi:hypothetical protein